MFVGRDLRAFPNANVHVGGTREDDLDRLPAIGGLLDQLVTQYEREIKGKLLFLHPADACGVVRRASADCRRASVPGINDDRAKVQRSICRREVKTRSTGQQGLRFRRQGQDIIRIAWLGRVDRTDESNEILTAVDVLLPTGIGSAIEKSPITVYEILDRCKFAIVIFAVVSFIRDSCGERGHFLTPFQAAKIVMVSCQLGRAPPALDHPLGQCDGATLRVSYVFADINVDQAEQKPIGWHAMLTDKITLKIVVIV